MKTVLKTLLAVFLAFLLLIFACFAYLLTPSGLRTGIDLADEFLPGKITTSHVSGSLLGPLTLKNFRYQQGQQSITIKRLYLKWEPMHLFKKTVDIKVLQVDGLHIISPPTPHKKTKPSTTIEDTLKTLSNPAAHLKLPFALHIHSAALTDIQLGPNAKTITTNIPRMTLNAKITDTFSIHAKVELKKPRVAQAQFDLTGTPSAYQFQLSLKHDNVAWDLVGQGDTHHLSMKTDKTQFFDGTLKGHAKIQWSPTLQWTLHVNGHFSQTTLLLNSTGNAAQHSMQFKLHAPQANVQFALTGKINQNRWAGSIHTLSIQLPKHPALTLQKTALITASNAGIQISSLCFGTTTHNVICLQGHWHPDKPDALNASLNANLRTLTLLKAFLPQGINPSGQLRAQLSVGGTFSQPTVSGQLNLLNGALHIPSLNLTLSKIRVAMNAQGNTAHYTLSARSGNSPITIEGRTQFRAPDYPTTLSIHGKNVLIANSTEYQIYASPALRISVSKQQLHVDGSIHIPRATIAPQEFNNAVTLPEDQVEYVGLPKARSTPLKIYAQLTLTLGDHVHVDVAGAKGKLTGSLNINSTPGQTTLATGRISIHGKYSAYGHNLDIIKGSYAEYTNTPIGNPNLSINATKTINVISSTSVQQFSTEDITVGVSVRGNVSRPKITLYSIPPSLSQADILSYLLFGYASSTNSPSSYTLLLQAAKSLQLSGKKSGGFLDQLKHSLGFSEFGMESDTLVDALGNPISTQSNFVIGKRLTRRIYVRYSRGFSGLGLTNTNEFIVRYLINKYWSVQGITSTLGGGGDLLYTVEKN